MNPIYILSRFSKMWNYKQTKEAIKSKRKTSVESSSKRNARCKFRQLTKNEASSTSAAWQLPEVVQDIGLKCELEKWVFVPGLVRDSELTQR